MVTFASAASSTPAIPNAAEMPEALEASNASVQPVAAIGRSARFAPRARRRAHAHGEDRAPHARAAS
ncbi:hypothetical protein C7S16_0608 [Burkholderia thailandensis]|uniref:Uncharacterized protein n=1 Tax=Burkholderia thailandensis TaxID=57975 RepID=A0AAW9D5F7_BURTH|nr:hypothetical protein AQ475_09130 [Burkholderia thailandensis]AVR26397.1 hypothetical protein A8H32_16120 [Burkholderia thailandensis]MDW9237671.1 hypothetical protein [Burkholderia thailandensis]MDW9257017.1 hypothetical protein [Burkholderia thailandensis]PJO73451.1 hypothetical protein CWD92_04820 [Burkholderia thailandensis]